MHRGRMHDKTTAPVPSPVLPGSSIRGANCCVGCIVNAGMDSCGDASMGPSEQASCAEFFDDEVMHPGSSVNEQNPPWPIQWLP
mmetsp:Transcript_78454/g.151578  ORF Transcript_78454/g.151578 Transcript_78454/m.151578 type:complete len:84 (-) Transcript_78454:1360-1611(-)